MSIYDNTSHENFISFGLAGLTAMEMRLRHDVEHEHQIEFFDQIIQGEVDGNIKRLYFHMSRILSCGHPDCHYPYESPMPSEPYRIDFLPKS